MTNEITCSKIYYFYCTLHLRASLDITKSSGQSFMLLLSNPPSCLPTRSPTMRSGSGISDSLYKTCKTGNSLLSFIYCMGIQVWLAILVNAWRLQIRERMHHVPKQKQCCLSCFLLLYAGSGSSFLYICTALTVVYILNTTTTHNYLRTPCYIAR